MTIFSIRPDDAGIRNLRNDNAKPNTTKAVGQVSPYPEVHPAKVGFHEAVQKEVENMRQVSRHQPHQELMPSEQGERRQRKDRRQRQIPVLLDTRSGSERRLIQNNRLDELDEGDEADYKGLGIDIYT